MWREEKGIRGRPNNIIAEAKTTLNYDHTLSYGVYQITMQLNTFHKESNGVSEKNVYDYPILNGYLTVLKKNWNRITRRI